MPECHNLPIRIKFKKPICLNSYENAFHIVHITFSTFLDCGLSIPDLKLITLCYKKLCAIIGTHLGHMNT